MLRYLAPILPSRFFGTTEVTIENGVEEVKPDQLRPDHPLRRWDDGEFEEDWRLAMRRRDSRLYSRISIGPIHIVLLFCYLGGILAVLYLLASWALDFFRRS
jgi:hypothetical protein